MLTSDSTVKIERKQPSFEIADIRRAAVVTSTSVEKIIRILKVEGKFETDQYIIHLIKE